MVERGGRIRLVEGRQAARRSPTSPESRTGGERGLLSVAFAPDYPSSRLLYVYFTNGSGDLEIAELHADSDGLPRGPGDAAADRWSCPIPASRTTTAASSSSGPTASSTRAPETAAAPGDSPTTPRTRTRSSASCCGSTRPPGSVGIYSHRPRNPYSVLLRPDDGSRARRGSRSATSGQDRFEEIDYLHPRRGQRRELRLERLRGLRPVRGRASPHREPDGEADQGLRHLRRMPARSSAAMWCATSGCRRCFTATSTGTSAPARSAR